MPGVHRKSPEFSEWIAKFSVGTLGDGEHLKSAFGVSKSEHCKRNSGHKVLQETFRIGFRQSRVSIGSESVCKLLHSLTPRSNGNRAVFIVLVNNAAFHHKCDAPHRRNLFQRIAVESNDVRLQTGHDRANLVGHVDGFCSE